MPRYSGRLTPGREHLRQSGLHRSMTAVTTRVFPGLAGNRMALKLNGKDDRLRLRDFLAMARTIGLPAGEAETAVAELTTRLSRRAAILELPELAQQSETARTMRDRVTGIVAERSAALMETLS